VRDAIVIGAAIQARFGLSPSSATVAGADVVLIVTAEPSPYKPIAGFATCTRYL
jgi:hypothetical protein